MLPNVCLFAFTVILEGIRPLITGPNYQENEGSDCHKPGAKSDECTENNYKRARAQMWTNGKHVVWGTVGNITFTYTLFRINVFSLNLMTSLLIMNSFDKDSWKEKSPSLPCYHFSSPHAPAGKLNALSLCNCILAAFSSSSVTMEWPRGAERLKCDWIAGHRAN